MVIMMCKVLFFLWLADTSLSFVYLFVCEFKNTYVIKTNIKVLSQFQNLNILLFFQNIRTILPVHLGCCNINARNWVILNRKHYFPSLQAGRPRSVAGWSGAWGSCFLVSVLSLWPDKVEGLGGSWVSYEHWSHSRELHPHELITLQRPRLLNTITLQSWDFKVPILGRRRDFQSVTNA